MESVCGYGDDKFASSIIEVRGCVDCLDHGCVSDDIFVWVTFYGGYVNVSEVGVVVNVSGILGLALEEGLGEDFGVVLVLAMSIVMEEEGCEWGCR